MDWETVLKGDPVDDKLVTIILPEWLGFLYAHRDTPPTDTDVDSLQRRITELTRLAGVHEAIIALQSTGLEVEVMFEGAVWALDDDDNLE